MDTSKFCSIILLVFGFCSQNILMDDSSDNSIFGNVVESFVKDLFKKEMKTVDNANMTDCMTRLLCEQICQRTVSGVITEPLIDSQDIMGKDPSLPKNLPYFFSGGDSGFELGQNKKCDQCAQRYKHCSEEQYESALDMTNQFISNLAQKNGS